eukprot:227283-Rhodomonas_salina.1
MNTNRGSAGSWRSNEEQLRCQDPDLPPNPTALHVASTGEEMEWEGAGRNVPTAGQDEHIEASHGFAPSANRKNHARLQIEGSAETPKHRRLKEEAQKLQRVQDKTSDTLHLIAKQNAKNMDLVKECENMLGSDQSSWTQEARRELQQLMQGMERERALLTSATSMDQKAKELLTTDPVFSQVPFCPRAAADPNPVLVQEKPLAMDTSICSCRKHTPDFALHIRSG